MLVSPDRQRTSAEPFDFYMNKICLSLQSRLKIIVTSRSPLLYRWQDPRVEFVAIDFLQPVGEVISKMYPLCGDVTHAYFSSYVHHEDLVKLKELNVPLFKTFLDALEIVAMKTLQRVLLQTGGKVGANSPSACLSAHMSITPPAPYSTMASTKDRSMLHYQKI